MLMSTNKFWKGILLGALAGGAISLLDRQTRTSVVESCKKGTKEVSHYISHPTEMAEKIKVKTSKLRSTVEQVSEDVSFIAEKVEELRDVTPTVVGIVKDTKEAFAHDEEEIPYS
ncbi:YtxH domain-containing protein [Robertmurraya kyonggiensis]|uniref:YtxH domain-containing protein n=2 Tax=Robertmurraya kyonggiensis TaxID=1037680 RepID=A0A4U1D4Z7_9BACI|nr:YtxH domain-containing protein [Robertmurraya kyonggiensis]